jgi:hypothetical protein
MNYDQTKALKKYIYNIDIHLSFEFLNVIKMNREKLLENFKSVIWIAKNAFSTERLVGGDGALLDTGTNGQGFFHVKHIIDFF